MATTSCWPAIPTAVRSGSRSGRPIVTNCGIDVWRARWLHQWDDQMWFHICAGLGTNPFAPIRFACRPEASLLTLVPRGQRPGR